MPSFCKLFMVALIVCGVAYLEVSESSPVLPSDCVVSGYLAKKEEATAAQLEEIASLPVLSLDTESDSDSSGTAAVYEKVLSATDTSPSTKNEAAFYEAIAEVASAYYKACFSGEPSSLEFTSLLAKYNSALERSDAKALREAFGSLTCLKKKDSTSARKRRAEKRSNGCTSPADIDDFFDCLDATDLGAIFFATGVPFSVAFVIDDTSSMGAEIEAVKCLVRSFIKSERDGPSKYILGTFNDPANDTTFFTPKSYDTDSLPDMQSFISDLNSIVVHGGVDWPEYSIGGIKRAFDASIKNVADPLGGTFSQLLLFTDADAKDYDEINDVFLRISSSDVVVSAFLPGVALPSTCGSYADPTYQACIDGTMHGYADLVDESGGILVGSLADGTSLSKFINEYNFNTGAHLSSIDCSKRKKRSQDSRERRAASPETLNFNVSDVAEQFRVVISTASTSDVQIINPAGTTVISESIKTIGFFTVGGDDIISGTWTVTSTSSFSMDVNIENSFIFSAELLDNSNELVDSLPPFGCTANLSLVISTPHLLKLSTASSAAFYASLVTADGEVLGSTVLDHCGAYLRGTVTVPGKPFYVQFNGISKDGYAFSSTGYGRFNPSSWSLQSAVMLGNSEIPAGESRDFTFSLSTANAWPHCALTVDVEASTTLRGVDLVVNPVRVPVNPSVPAEVTVRASAASDAEAASGRLELSFRGHHDGKEISTLSTLIGIGKSGCPCKNDGTCKTFRRGGRVFNRCVCPAGYSGTLCEQSAA